SSALALPTSPSPSTTVEVEVAVTVEPDPDVAVTTTAAQPSLQSVSGNVPSPSASSDSSVVASASVVSSSTTTDCEAADLVVLNDIGNFIGKDISDFQKQELLMNPWRPPDDYKFPFSTYKCHKKGVQTSFGGVGGKDKTVKLTKLVTEPLLTFKDLCGSEKNSVLASHENSVYHKTAVEKGDVINQVNQQRLATIQDYRERLVPIIRATQLLGRQGLAFRGHRDDGPLITDENDKSASATRNEGNFRELLRFMVESGDKKLEEHLKNSKSNATKTSQNQLIDCIGDEIVEKILTRVRGTMFYSILFDETTDMSHKSQLSAIIRYVTRDAVYEDFISFIDAFDDHEHEGTQQQDGGTEESADEAGLMMDEQARQSETERRKGIEIKMTGKHIGQIVLRLLKKLGLPLNKCVGIGTDGCSVMTSAVCGAVAEIQKEAKNALRTPCYSHKLNLSLSQSSKVTCIRNAVGTMKECINFFYSSAKRCHTLYKFLGHSLSGLCETRWIERHDGVLQFSVDLPKILEALESIENWDDTSTSSKASQLKAALTNSFFLVSVMCLSDILALTLPLSKLFQKSTLNLDTAAETISGLKSVLSSRREKAEEHFNILWAKIEGIAEEVDTHLIPPRRCGRQGNRANYATESPESYFRQAVFIPLLDHVLMDLEERFPPDVLTREPRQVCFNLPLLLPCNLTAISQSDLKQKTELLVKNFHALLPYDVDLSEKVLLGELTLWRQKWLTKDFLQLPQSSFDVLKCCDNDVYPVIHKLLSVLTTLPVSNASAERSFSALRRLKSWLRTTMSQNRLRGLALMHVHRDEEISTDSIIIRFAKCGNRRIDFII
ncbi:52 kDa repressor of the inhibitor of the protein kinase, partial [Frankliniella fusca]